jgi:DNA-binding CsgD family transcriptional regulator
VAVDTNGSVTTVMDTSRRTDQAGTDAHSRAAAIPATRTRRDRSDRALSVVRRLYGDGKLAAAIDVGRTALAGRRSAEAPALLRYALGEAEFYAGATVAAARTLAPALADTTVPAPVRAAAHGLYLLAVSVHDAGTAAREVESILGPGTGGGPDATTAAASAVAAQLSWDDGDTATAMRLAHRAVHDLGPTTPATPRMHVCLTLAHLLGASGADEPATVWIRRARDGAAGPAQLTWCAIAHADLLARLGQHAEATREADSALRRALDMEAGLLVPLAAAVRIRLAVRAGDLLTAAHLLAAGSDRATPAASTSWHRLMLAAACDGPRAAVAAAASLDESTLARIFLDDPGAAARLVRLALGAGDSGLVRRLLRSVDDLAARNRDHRPLAVAALHALAVAQADPAALTRAAAEHLDPWAAACATEDLVGVPPVDGPSGRSLLHSVADRFDAIGAHYDAARVRARLRAAGLPSAGWRAARTGGELTVVERAIALLVSRGLTNQQIAVRVFLSPHTVNYHLRQMFRKLSITSRAELARIAAAQIEPPATRR